jgi:hypothetical protein
MGNALFTQKEVGCSRCACKYYRKYDKWPEKSKYKAVYKLEIETDDIHTDTYWNNKLPKDISKYWYCTNGNTDSDKKWKLRFKACERCARHNPDLVKYFEYVPDGWTEIKK